MIGLDEIDDVVLVVMMDTHGRAVIWPLMRHAWILGNKADDAAQALLVAVGLLPPEIQEALEPVLEVIE